MDLGLKGKRAVVLGSTRGLGQGIATILAEEGAALAVCGRAQDDAAAVATGLASAHGVTAHGFGVDLASPESVEEFCGAVESALGGVDILVLNGGGPPPGAAAEITPAQWGQHVQSMFLCHTQMTARFLPGMRAQGWGRILVCSSSGTVQPIPALAISNTYRAALISWAKTLSNEVAPDGVTVNTILPGRIKTERLDQIDEATAKRQGKNVEDVVAASRTTIPAGRYGTVEEFAAMAAFLVSDRAGYVTGSVARVDGGFIRSV
jgi:3-oxoacyl-[acyl-carrier protein] reductase